VFESLFKSFENFILNTYKSKFTQVVHIAIIFCIIMYIFF